MAYTQSPEKQTYGTQNVPGSYPIDLRAGSLLSTGVNQAQDSGMVNLLPIKALDVVSKQQEPQAITRQPIQAWRVVGTDLVNRGCYVWEKTAGTVYYFSVNGTGVYTSTDTVTWTLVTTLTTVATTPVRFTEFVNDTNTKSLVLVDGIEGYVFTSNLAGTKITDVDFPSPHVPFPVFMDGFLFLAKKGTGDIYNSNLNNPALWTAGDYISSELYPDDVQALVKINNYLLAIGTNGSEFFYDAAVATGSPLARYEGGSLAFGTVVPNSIASNKNQVVFIANNNDGENTIKIIEDFKTKEVPSAFLIELLNARLQDWTTVAASVRGFFFRQHNDSYYCLAFDGVSSTPNPLNTTFAFNFATDWWTELRFGAGGATPFPVWFTALSPSNNLATFVSGHYGGSPFFGTMQARSTAQDEIVNGVGLVPIYTEMRTPNLAFGTQNLKMMSRFGVELSESSSTTTVSGTDVTLNVSYTDDDYSTFSTPRSLIFSGTYNFPFITQLGAFRQRAFKLTYSGVKFLRYKSLSMDINKGQQ